MADQHGNFQAREGCDRCSCGCKYWEKDRCVSCGEPFRPTACEDCGVPNGRPCRAWCPAGGILHDDD